MVALWSPEFACVFQKGTTSRESFDATKSRDFLKKGTTWSIACTNHYYTYNYIHICVYMRYIYIYSVYIYVCVCRTSHPTSFRVCHVMPRHMAPQVPWLLDRPPAGGSPCLPRHARCRSIRGPSDRSSPGWGPPHLSNFVGMGEKNPMVSLW